MSDGQNLINKILADAKKQAEKITAEAQAEAENIINEAENKAKAEMAKLNSASDAEAKKAASKEISSAEMRARKLILSQKQACLKEVLEEVENKLSSLDEEQYCNMIIKMLQHSEYDSDCQVILSKTDKNTFAERLINSGYNVSEETAAIDGGFIVRKGDIEYNYSFKSVISVEKEEILQLASGILFA